ELGPNLRTFFPSKALETGRDGPASRRFFAMPVHGSFAVGSWGCPTMRTVEAAFFDLDKTIISKSSSLALTRPMYRAGLVSRSMLLRGAYAQLVYLLLGADEKKMDRAKEAMTALSKGWEKVQVEELVREVLIELIDPYVYQEALDLMALHRA